jgi:hypothetical protein
MKILKPTFGYLSRLFKPTSVTLRSSYISLEGITATLGKADRHFSLAISGLKTYQGMDQDFEDSYGLFKPFKFEKNGVVFDNPKGAANVLFNLNGLSANCKLQQLESNIGYDARQYYRLMLPRVYNNNKDPYEFISSERLETDTGVVGGAGLINFTVNCQDFELFNCDEDEAWYLALDNVTPITFEVFKQTVNAVLFSLGFITGELHRNEMIILQSANADFQTINGCYYEQMKDTVSSGMEVVSPSLWEIKSQRRPTESYLDRQSFGNLVTLALNDQRLLRALQIITEGNAYPFEIRASVYSVALETIKNIIMEENQEKINPFKSREFAKKTVKDLVAHVRQLDDEAFNSKQAVINKLEHLNQVTNKDSFLAAFLVYNFQLSQSDKNALNSRNDFLHGRIPFEGGEDADLQLKIITYKMHYLVSILILKYVGFRGWIRNTPLFFAALMKQPDLSDETLFVR